MAEIVNMPKLGFDMAEGTLVRWVINEQEAVEKGQVLAEIETDKATVEVESPFTGIVRRHLVEQDAVVPVSTPIAVIGESDEEIDFDRLLVEVQEAETAGGEAAESEPDVSQDKVEASITEARREAGFNLPDGVRASPLARRMAEKLGINMRQVKGSGPNGRITKADIESYQAAPQAGQQLQPVVFPAVSGEIPPDRNIPLSKLRTAIGKRMVQSKVEFPQFFVTHEFDVAALIDLRRQVNALLAEGEKTSINDYLVKAAALALREFPNLNAQLGTDGKSVTQFGHVNIGVAVAVENGLLTVVCRDADLKPVQQISMEIREMAGRAREGKVRADDIEGSTFSVSNLGMFDVEEFIAIINPPEAAILAIGSANQVAVVEDKRVVPGWRMKATISVDHRVSDGAEAARFMQALTRYVEEPLRLILPDLSGQAAS
ncbi:MAG: dihydrolipoamide acetyltransferase family protein [Anaerolineales bacterium]|jgi:pyruvate dehydrogenase E2 component (dihydrolipoamide acetyltransferase)